MDNKEIIPANDDGLNLIVDYCKKTKATIGGDSYSEVVLYHDKKNDIYQIHTYEQHGIAKEIHHAYKATKENRDYVYELIEKLELETYRNVKGFGLCGGEYIVKFKKDKEMVRISTNNLGVDGPAILCQVGNLLYSFI